MIAQARIEAARDILPGLVHERCFTVTVGGETFGLPVTSVHTIFRLVAVTPVPMGPPEVVGLVNLRGKIVTAISLRQRLRMEADGSVLGTLAIGIEHGKDSYALVVDEVGDVIPLDVANRIALPSHMGAERTRLTRSVYRLEGGILPILDMDAVFTFGPAEGHAP